MFFFLQNANRWGLTSIPRPQLDYEEEREALSLSRNGQEGENKG